MLSCSLYSYHSNILVLLRESQHSKKRAKKFIFAYAEFFFHEKETFQPLTIFLRIQLNYFWKTSRIFFIAFRERANKKLYFLVIIIYFMYL